MLYLLINMKIKYCITLAFYLSCYINLVYSQDIPQDSLIRTGKLSNGLTYFIRNNASPKRQADFYLVQKVGSVLEEEQQRGLAHFLEHMAFNGTKHFPGNTLVAELEKKGIQFGTNINAYTGYDETVYRLTNIPVSRESILDTALLVLHDWSGFILNEDKDIDEERKVIREEWRTRSNGYLRVQESQIIPVLLKESPYANRLPIGSMDIVMNFKYQQLKDYYKKWYRPDLQGIIIVGDVDVNQVENKLKVLFGNIPAAVQPIVLPEITIPDHKEALVAIATDPEIRNASAMVYWRQKPVSVVQNRSIHSFKIGIINNLISNLINQRFADLAGKGRSWSSLSKPGTYAVASHIPAWTLDMNVPDNQIMKALKADLLEMERIRRFGFIKNELDPTMRKFYLMLNEADFYDQEQVQNATLVQGLLQQYLKGETLAGQSWKYKATEKILKELTIDTLNFYAKKYLSTANIAVAILYPGKADLLKPDKAAVMNLLDSIQFEKLGPWFKAVKPDDFSTLITPKGPKIVRTDKETAPFGFTRWEFSNGVKVWFKNTGFKESKVIVFGFKPGGYSRVSLKELPSALAYNPVVKLAGGFEGGGGGLFYTAELNKYMTYISTIGTKMNVKQLFQNIYLHATRFKEDPKTFENWNSRKLQEIRSRAIVPKVVFGDTLNAIMSNRHPRAISLQNEEILRQVSYDKIKKLHQKFFGNARNFNYVIVGNLNIDTVELLAKTWLGSLPSPSHTSSKIVDHGLYPPQGIIKKQFRQTMEVPQSTITVGYTGKIPYTLENRKMINILSDILKQRYMEEIREKEGGSYGVSVHAELIDLPQERYIFQINFDTAPDPEKKKHLLAIVYQEIEKIKNQGPTAEQLNTVKRLHIKIEQEASQKKDANYWYNRQGLYLLYGRDFYRDGTQILDDIDLKKLKDFANRIFGQGNLIEVIMDPQ